MSMTLLLWKAPVTDDEEVAEKLLAPYYKNQDDSGFEPSPDLAAFTRDLLQRYPDPADQEPYDGPWADGIYDTDRILFLSIRWGADDAFLDEVLELARKYELVLYDPQGPNITLPGDEEPSAEPIPAPGVLDHLKVVGMAIVAAGVVWLGWTIDVPILRWVLMIAGGFFLSVVLFLLWILLFESRKDEPKPRA